MEALIKRVGIERVAFITLTFRENLTDYREAQRRFNSLATHVLRQHLSEWVVAVERQGRGAIHYHLLAVFPVDIRTGFDFASCRQVAELKRLGDIEGAQIAQRRYFASANQFLRNWWTLLRNKAGDYGFGRCETLPVLSGAGAVARYVGAYVTETARNRSARDHRMRTVRYALKHRVASGQWSWVNGAAATWRKGCRILGLILGVDDFTPVLGKRWAWNWRETITLAGKHSDKLLPYLLENLGDMPSNADERLKLAIHLAQTLHEKAEREEGAQTAPQ
jgi:hypothetical protein